MAYGGVVTRAPSGAPSRRNCTPTTSTSSEAFAETDTLPETLVPLTGDVMTTVGAPRSLRTVTVTLAALAVVPLLSRAIAVST
jgi:hypothetical protein